MVIIVLIVLYIGAALGIYTQASVIKELQGVRWFSFAMPIIMPVFLVYTAIKTKSFKPLLMIIAAGDSAALILLQGIAYLRKILGTQNITSKVFFSMLPICANAISTI